MTKPTLFACAMVLGLLAVVGCGQGPEYAFDRLDLQRYGWDSLSVKARFSERLFWGRTRPAEPQAVAVYLFNAGYDTLYAGDGRLVSIADRALGDRERLMLEVCGRFETMTVCGQEAVTASPKRLRLEPDIDYPDEGAYERGRYVLRFVAERQDEDGVWQPLGPAKGVHGYLRVYVGDESQKAVEVPFSGQQGRFTLQGRPHFNDFQYQLTSLLMDEQAAPVHFQVYAGFAGHPVSHVASVEKQVRDKTDEERALDVAHFVEQAVAAIFEALEVFEIDGLAEGDSTAWVFHPLTNTYRIKVAMVWQGRRSFLRRRQLYEVAGVLEVEASGVNARFLRQAANARAARRWAATIGEGTLSLGTLAPYVHDREEE